MNLIDIMRNPRKRKPYPRKVTPEIIKRIQRERPPKREGRMQFYQKVANEINVSVGAINQAMQRQKLT